jgi:hypothetical protein
MSQKTVELYSHVLTSVLIVIKVPFLDAFIFNMFGYLQLIKHAHPSLLPQFECYKHPEALLSRRKFAAAKYRTSGSCEHGNEPSTKGGIY